MSAGSIEERERRLIIMRIEPTSLDFPPKSWGVLEVQLYLTHPYVSFFHVFLICRSAHLPCWPNPPSLYPHLAIGVRAIAVKACVIPPPSGEAEEPYKGRVPKLRLLCGLPYHHHHHLAIHQLFSVEESCWHYHIPVMAILALSRGGPDHKQTGIKLADPLELQSFQLKCCEVVTNVPPEKNIFWVFNFI